jgi:tetratricopeptide (TPR) repeat protein
MDMNHHANTSPAMQGLATAPLAVAVCVFAAGLWGMAPAHAAQEVEAPSSVISASGATPAVSAPAPHQVASTWALGGWKFMDRGDYRGARQVFLAASHVADQQAGILVGLAVSWYRSGHDDRAMPWLERALLLDPHVEQANRLLGEIYERRGDVKRSLAHFESALRQDPADVTLREHVFTLRRAVEFEATLDRLYSRHFVVEYPQGRGNRALARSVADRMERAYASVGRLFSYYPSIPLTVVLYPKEQFHAETLSPSWAGSLYDGRMHVTIPPGSPAPALEEFEATLTHEYTHAVVARLSGGRAPSWLQEGLAQYGEHRLVRRPSSGTTGMAGGTEPLEQLHGSFAGETQQHAALAYAESDRAVWQLIDRHGMAKLRKLLTTLAEKPSFDEAYREVFGESFQRAGRPEGPADPKTGERAAGGHEG